MFKTFNMGWGFAIIVDKGAEEEAVDSLERGGVEASRIGSITDSGKIIVKYQGTKIALSRD
jgi:phosphoribosylaminoimidazole (AIR) synthetase